MCDHEKKSPIPVASCILKHDGRFLVMLRRYPPGDGRWALPAGHVEPGENAEECICREVLEETGLVLDRMSLRFLRTFGKINDAGQSFLSVVFTADAPSDIVTLDHENLDYVWVPFENGSIDAVDWAFENQRRVVYEYMESVAKD